MHEADDVVVVLVGDREYIESPIGRVPNVGDDGLHTLGFIGRPVSDATIDHQMNGSSRFSGWGNASRKQSPSPCP